MKAASKLIALTSLGLAMLLGGGCANLKENTKMDTIYQFTAKGRNGTSLDLASLKGQVLLIVNTATGCGFTPQCYSPWGCEESDTTERLHVHIPLVEKEKNKS